MSNTEKQQAVQELYQNYILPLRFGFTTTIMDPEDLKQRVAEKLLEKDLETLKGIEAPLSFVFKIAKDFLKDEKIKMMNRKRIRETKMIPADVAWQMRAPMMQPEKQYILKELAEQMLNSIKNLDKREAVINWMNDYFPEELSEKTGICKDTIKTRLKDAKKKLRKEFASEADVMSMINSNKNMLDYKDIKALNPVTV